MASLKERLFDFIKSHQRGVTGQAILDHFKGTPIRELNDAKDALIREEKIELIPQRFRAKR